MKKNGIGFFFKKKKQYNNFIKINFNKGIKLEKISAIKNQKGLATRKASESVLNSITPDCKNIIGGSADLAGSNNTKTKFHEILKPKKFNGNYIHYGVREHAMCGIMNGLSLHSNLIPYGGTFDFFRLLQTFYSVISINGTTSNLCDDT